MERTKRIARRDFLRWSSLATAVGLFAGCAPKVVEVEKVVKETVQVEKQVTKEVVKEVAADWPTVRWAARPPGEGYDAIMELLDVWEGEKKIRVLYEPIPGDWDDIIQKMMAGFAAGDAPEIWRMYGPYVRKCIDFKVALDLNPYIEKENFDLSDFIEGQLLASQKDGKQYGVPDYCGIWATWYNADLFEEAGLPVPDKETWDIDQYVDYTLRLTKRDDSGMLLQAGAETSTSLEFGLSTAIWSYGGEVSDDTRTLCRMTETPAMDALKIKAAQKWEHKVTPSPAETASLSTAGGWGVFPSGKAGFREDGAWFLCRGCGNDDAIGDKFRYGALPHWKGPTGKRETFCTTDTWMGSPQAEYPDAVWEFLKMLCGPEMQEILAKDAHLQPARKSVAHLWASDLKEHIVSINPKMEAFDLSPFVEGYAYARPMFWWACHTAAMEILQPVLDQIYTTNTGTVDELIPPVCEEISKITC